MNQPIPGPGWHPDPGGTPQYRYWDGTRWTEHVAPLAPDTAPNAQPLPRRSGAVIAAAVAGVVLLVLVSAAIAVALRSDENNDTTEPVTAGAIVEKVASIPAGVFRDVGPGNAGPLPSRLPGPLRTKNGKPLILYMGSEYCPYCATERWSIVAALSRFGTFENVGIIRSAGFPEAYPATPTFSFHGSAYTSPYITFEGVEMRSNQPDPSGSGWKIRDVPTPEQRALMDKYDSPPYVPARGAGAIPFIDFADSFLISGSTYSPQVLQGKDFNEIADAMADTSTAVSRGAIGSANLITAAICAVTKDQPAKVCDDEMIQTLEDELRAVSATS